MERPHEPEQPGVLADGAGGDLELRPTACVRGPELSDGYLQCECDLDGPDDCALHPFADETGDPLPGDWEQREDCTCEDGYGCRLHGV